MRLHSFFFLLLLFLSPFFKAEGKDAYLIGRDPYWTPFRFEFLNPQVNIFVNTLIAKIGEDREIQLQLVSVDWIQLLQGLNEGKYEGALTTLTPNLITENQYTFSEPFLLNGPVLVVSKKSHITSLSDLREGIIGVSQYDDSVLIVQQNPSLIIKPYEMMPQALQDLENGTIDALLFESLKAHSLIPKRYPKLKIVSSPLNESGLRLIVVKGQHEKLIESFNQGLENLKKARAYQKLREKFSLK